MKKRARIKRIISTFVKYDGINFLLALIILLFLILRFRECGKILRSLS